MWCPNCGLGLASAEKFCRNCGMPSDLNAEQAAAWLRSPEARSPAQTRQQTVPITPSTTSPTDVPAYVQPAPPPVPYQPPVYSPPSKIRLGDWLSGGWQVYKENAMLMSVATLIAALLGTCTLGILAGPLLMGLYNMAFKTMKGERPVMSDLFAWQGRFLQAFLTFLIFFVIHVGLGGAGNNNPFFGVLSFVATPLLSVMLAFTMSLVFDRGIDVVTALNHAGRLVFSRDAVMWWVVGLVLAAITVGGSFACGAGVLLTLPWMISASAVAYRDFFGLDDPNRTLH